jgi:hypothetical protein
MKMKGRKVICFWYNNFIIATMFIISLLKSPETVDYIAIIGGLILNSIIFIGGNTYDKWIRSKHYKEGLYGKNQEDI